MFDEDSQTGKGKYSMDGGSTWQNFSSGGSDWGKVVIATAVLGNPAYFPITVYDDNNTVIVQLNVASFQNNAIVFYGGDFYLYYQLGGTMYIHAIHDVIVNGTLLQEGQDSTPISYVTANPYTITKP